MRIERCDGAGLADWVALRQVLWPEGGAAEHRAEAEALLARPEEAVAFLARDPAGAAIGFAEARLRRDPVNGCATSPVAFLEGILVLPGWRRRGLARALSGAVEAWALSLGCAELASDALLDNAASHRMHRALRFEETERVVFYRKALAPRPG
ncbi:aminoglycoside 6'-N-acetyltransferase [Roseicella aerolata]|uniref:aminoglycoside 6'-N-acetyltransferase n=1 Tax=Roseicella aerolata TaxID=2883479 RepID=UPI0021F58CD3|nr:aminoglycoside 6'-N-acetyltransferase [Roseicella aerolata]